MLSTWSAKNSYAQRECPMFLSAPNWGWPSATVVISFYQNVAKQYFVKATDTTNNSRKKQASKINMDHGKAYLRLYSSRFIGPVTFQLGLLFYFCCCFYTPCLFCLCSEKHYQASNSKLYPETTYTSVSTGLHRTF